MGLHPMTLGHFIASSPDTSATTMLHHCFHPQLSLKLLLSILDGVQYLHSVGVVHRDLKPTNIFLSVYDGLLSPAGCVGLYDCKECRDAGLARQSYLGVRIGDFGLVTSIARPEEENAATRPGKPVGTEFYRPPVCSKTANEKLDVYALGVIGFELLWRFGTRMERHESLMDLKKGQFPSCFAEKLGKLGKEIEECLKDMVECDESRRFTCDQVRQRLSEMIASLSH
jgi:eukaryotic translation initiation factor 2-alpha kinase 3